MGASKESVEESLLRDAQIYLEAMSRGQVSDEQTRLAWKQFYAKCDSLIRRFTHAHGVNRDDLEDCVQDVWVQLLKKLIHFKYEPGRATFPTWLYLFVHYVVGDRFRHEARCHRHEGTRIPETILEDPNDPASICEMKDAIATVRRVFNSAQSSMSELNYKVLCMRVFSGIPVAEVARQLGLSPQQVWVRQHRAKRKLCALLAQHFDVDVSVAV